MHGLERPHKLPGRQRLQADCRDHRSDRPQIVYALLCSPDGCPVAIEAFPGNTADPDTLTARVQLLRERFGLQRVALVGERGMLALLYPGLMR